MEPARLAQPADAERCAQLCRDALESLQERRGGALFARRETGLLAKALLRPGGLSRLLSDPRRRVLVGTVDDVIVSLAVGRVDPAHRGLGAGHALLHALVEWFGESGCRSVDATALPGDRETKSFFEGAGFKARLLTMHRALR